ncbi:MAG: YciI family protein [Pseudomonadota bacterium]
MPLFLINSRDKAGAEERRLANRQAHLEWAGEYRHKIAMAGPVLSDDGETMIGSTFVIEFEILEEAQNWASNDPYAKAGVFDRTEVIPFIWLIGDGPTNG